MNRYLVTYVARPAANPNEEPIIGELWLELPEIATVPAGSSLILAGTVKIELPFPIIGIERQ